MMDMDKLAECILAARLNGKMPAPTDQWVGSADIDSAYSVQRTLLGEIARRDGGTVIGRKVGCTNQSARDLLVRRAVSWCAVISHHDGEPSPDERSDYPFIVLEPEFALKLGKPLEPENAPPPAESVAGAVDAVLPALEIVPPVIRTGPVQGQPS